MHRLHVARDLWDALSVVVYVVLGLSRERQNTRIHPI